MAVASRRSWGPTLQRPLSRADCHYRLARPDLLLLGYYTLDQHDEKTTSIDGQLGSNLLSLLVTSQKILTVKCSVTLVTGKARLLMAQLVSPITDTASVICSSVELH